MSSRSSSPQSLDGVRLAVITSRLERIVRSMMNTLVRTGRSGVLNTARDFSCCILSPSGELLVMAESLPIHLMSGPELMSKSMLEFHPTLRRGDAFLHNSPYHGNSHAADHSLLVPIVDEDGVHRFTAFAKAHQADCGNAEPTTYATGARDVYEEGALIFPCVKVQEDYVDNADIIRMCKSRIRVPDQWWGDYLALMGAARIGERLTLELGAELGWDVMAGYSEAWFDYSEGVMAAALSALPAKTVSLSSRHDPFPAAPDGIPMNLTIRADPDSGRVEVDLQDNIDCQPCGLNLSEATARTAALLGIFNSLDDPVPANAGSFRRIGVQLRENCVIGIPRFPASCSAATTNLADRLTNLVQRAMAELAEGIGLAEAGLVIPPSAGVISGRDARRENSFFVNQLLLAFGSGPASAHADGWQMFGDSAAAGVPFRDSVELDELRFPVHIAEQRVVPDREGAGRFRGSPPARVEYGPTDCAVEFEVMYASDGTVFAPQGARGGQPGRTAEQFKRDAAGELIPVDACARLRLEVGEAIVSLAAGAGGYGVPWERDVELVRSDVRERLVSVRRAADAYGVAIDESGIVDTAETARLRQELARTAAEAETPEALGAEAA